MNEELKQAVEAVASPLEQELNEAYAHFQREMSVVGQKVNDLWQKAWQERFKQEFGKYAVSSGSYLKIRSGLPPSEMAQVVATMKASGHKVQRIEFDDLYKEFRIYTIPA